MGRAEPAEAGARDDALRRPYQPRDGRPRPPAVGRARQDHPRCQGRHPARARGLRVRDRHPAPDERRVFRKRGAGHRRLLDAPAARRCRRHNAVQFSRDDPVVEGGAGDRLRQRVRAEAVRAQPVGAAAPRRAVPRGRAATGHFQCRQRRQGSRRRDPGRPAHCGRGLRRFVEHRAVHLCGGGGAWKACAMFRRRQESYDRHARRRPRPGGGRTDRRRLRLGRRALHGDLGGRPRRRQDGGRTDGAPRAEGAGVEGRFVLGRWRRLWAAGDEGRDGEGARLRRGGRARGSRTRRRRPRIQDAGLREWLLPRAVPVRSA